MKTEIKKDPDEEDTSEFIELKTAGTRAMFPTVRRTSFMSNKESSEFVVTV